MKDIDCTTGDHHERVALYLAGRLPGDEARALENHYLGCDRCSTALREAGELRAALGKPVLVPRPELGGTPAVRRDWGTLAAAAATVAILVFGVRHLAEQPPVIGSAPVYRSGEARSLALTVEAAEAGQAVLEWPAHDEAQTYRIEIVRSDGLPILESETSRRRVVLDFGDLPPLPAGVSVLARVEALDGLGQVVATSERVTILR